MSKCLFGCLFLNFSAHAVEYGVLCYVFVFRFLLFHTILLLGFCAIQYIDMPETFPRCSLASCTSAACSVVSLSLLFCVSNNTHHISIKWTSSVHRWVSQSDPWCQVVFDTEFFTGQLLFLVTFTVILCWSPFALTDTRHSLPYLCCPLPVPACSATVGWFHFCTLLQCYLWPSCVEDADIIFLPCGFFFYLLSFFFPRLILAVADWMSAILAHMVSP